MMEGNKDMGVPRIRFKGFEENWFTYPLKDFAHKSVEKNINRLYNETFTNSAEFGVISQRDFFDHNISNNENIDGYYIIHPDNFVYNPRISVTAPVGPISRNLLNRIGIMSPLYFIFTVNGINKNYLSCFFKTRLWHKYMLLNGNTGARFDRLSITDEKFLTMPIILPKNIIEQEQIASYFQSLDSLIQTISQKLAFLKQIKAASLQSMFPQEGETTPKVRFKGFEGEWEKDELGNLFKERIENNTEGELLSVTLNNGIIKASENGRFDNSNNDKSHYKVVKHDDIAYNTMRMWQGASGHSLYEGIVSPAYTVIIPQENVFSPFFAYLFKTPLLINKFKTHSQGLTTDTWNLKYSAFSVIEVYYPRNKSEQQKIATYFRNFDKQIALQTKRLEKLKQIKSACLDKMFV